MSATVLKDGTLLTFDDSTQAVQVLRRASVLIIDDRIAAIAESFEELRAPPDADIINVEGKIVSPGFVNTHVHMWQSVYRSIGPDIVLAQYFDWLSQMSANATNTFTPEDIYISCLEGYLEGLNAGVTTYLEHAHNNWSRDVVEPGFDAAVDSGARIWWCYDVAPRDDFTAEEQWQLLGRLTSKATQSYVKLGLSLDGLAGSCLTGSEEKLTHLRHMINHLKLEAITMHHMGGPWPQGNTAPTLLCARGFQNIGIPIVFSHAPFLTDEDMCALRQHDLFISITPESECHYGHGQKTGHMISDQASLGVDTNWTFSGDILSQSRLWLQTVRSRNYQKTLDSGVLPNKNPMAVEQAFLLATRQGGRALRRPDIGVLQVGAKADLVVFNGDSPNMLGWRNPVAAVMLHAHPGDIEHVLVDGRFRKRDFQLVNTTLSWSEIRARFLEASRRIQPHVEAPTPLPDKLWGITDMGDVDIASTIRRI
ncbi:hypothetical protein N7537_006179 [Penicillium hordei]|uniref:Amidohydrolase-related domain-containing protein n=1 Tax=Penicillium hordei TaxID=40994 RepID=A0AAD6E734_9EURO|nr:uncharacterized protein N7537_006179 [Penicillium hordei]KAJ5603223.1 hypothetical protein N7537_006179 [Penicillium hordei]